MTKIRWCHTRENPASVSNKIVSKLLKLSRRLKSRLPNIAGRQDGRKLPKKASTKGNQKSRRYKPKNGQTHNKVSKFNELHTCKPKMRRVSKPNARKPKIDKARNLGKKTQIPPCNDDDAAAAPESSSSVHG